MACTSRRAHRALCDRNTSAYCCDSRALPSLTSSASVRRVPMRVYPALNAGRTRPLYGACGDGSATITPRLLHAGASTAQPPLQRSLGVARAAAERLAAACGR